MKLLWILASCLSLAGCQKMDVEKSQPVKGREFSQGKLSLTPDDVKTSSDLKLKDDEEHVVFSEPLLGEPLGLAGKERNIVAEEQHAVIRVIVVPATGASVYSGPSETASILCDLEAGTQVLRLQSSGGFESVRLDRLVTKWGCPDSIKIGYLRSSDLANTMLVRNQTPVFSDPDFVNEVCVINMDVEVLVIQQDPLRIQMPILDSCPPTLETGYLRL